MTSLENPVFVCSKEELELLRAEAAEHPELSYERDHICGLRIAVLV